MAKKRKGRLIPIKKTVVDARIHKPIERTYYINPNKKKATKPKEKGEPELDITKVKNWEDFDKQGIDSNVAKQFFCNF